MIFQKLLGNRSNFQARFFIFHTLLEIAHLYQKNQQLSYIASI